MHSRLLAATTVCCIDRRRVLTVTKARKHLRSCHMKGVPKGWRRLGYKSHYQYLKGSRTSKTAQPPLLAA